MITQIKAKPRVCPSSWLRIQYLTTSTGQDENPRKAHYAKTEEENNGRLLLFTDVITLNIKSMSHRKIKDVDAKHNFLATGM